VPVRIGALIAASAPHLRALAEAIERGELPVSLEMVVASDASAAGLVWAQAAGLRTAVFDRQDIPSRARRQEAARRVFEAAAVDLVVCADYDEPLGEAFVRAFPERLVSASPALLPAFAEAADAVAAAFDAGVKVVGCTAYLAAPGAVYGTILVQRAIDVREVDTEQTLRERLEVESLLALSTAIRLLAEGRVQVRGRRARIV
jgi:phosphoribosylglycinamide formyltransferase 1